MRFDITPGSAFTPSYVHNPSEVGNTDIKFTITNLDDGRSWAIDETGVAPVTFAGPTGTLQGLAPAGHYELAWQSSHYTYAGMYDGGGASISLSVVPEPLASSAVIGMTIVACRRRR